MDPALVLQYGLPALFVVAFLAGSVVPFPSEAAMIALLGTGADPWVVVPIAAAGNFLGAVTIFVLGRMFVAGRSSRLAARMAAKDPKRIESSLRAARRWGAPVLLLTWLPIVGDLLVLAAGMVGIRTVPFAAFTATGKFLRFAAVAWLASVAL